MLADGAKISIVGIAKFQTSSNEIGMTEQTTILILGRVDVATIPLTTVPDEGIRIAQEDSVGRRNLNLEVPGTRMAGIVTYRMLGVVVTTNEDGDAIVLLPKTNPLDRGRGISLHLAKMRHPIALHVENPPHQGIVVLERGRGHLVEMPTVRDMNDVIAETTVLGLLVVPDLYLPAAARQRIKKEGGQSHAVDRLPAADGSHHHPPQALAVDQGHVVVAEGHPQEERTNVAAVMSLVAPTGHEIVEAEIAEGLLTKVNGPQDEDEIALLNHLPNLGVVNQLKPSKTNVPPRRRILCGNSKVNTCLGRVSWPRFRMSWRELLCEIFVADYSAITRTRQFEKWGCSMNDTQLSLQTIDVGCFAYNDIE